MILHLFRPTPGAHTMTRVCGVIVARAAAFYQDYDGPDTVNRRFEMFAPG